MFVFPRHCTRTLVESAATILCIDDDPDTLKLRKLVLETSGYSVVTANSGEEGLTDLARGQPIDLVVLDYLMPGLDGDEVAERIKAHRPTLPLILMSAVAQIPESLRARVNAYVQKGQDPEILLSAIKKILDGKRVEATIEKKTVLCVEDEDLQLQLRKLMFESAGFATLLARSGAEALQLVRTKPVDAVLMDYWLSGMNGTAVAREMRLIRPNLPIVILSGFTSLPGETIGVVDAWFHKAEHEPEELIALISELIQHREQAGSSGSQP